MRQRSPSKFGVIAILSALVIVILLSGLIIFSFLVKPEDIEPVKVLENPVSAVNAKDVDPALAIAQLGGISPLDVAERAINKSRPGAALATIIFSPEIEAKDAAGNLLLLANKFTQADDTAHARSSYQMAGTLATLSPDLSDTLRADIFVQAGIGLAEAGDPILAKIYLDQAFLVATESAYLQPAYRRTILEQLGQAYRNIGLKDLARKSLELSLNPANLETLSEAPLVLPVGKKISYPLEVQEAEAIRWQAAQVLGRELVELGGEARPETIAALQKALLKEDQVKSRFIAQALETEKQLSGKVDLLQAKINWQSIKYRLARQGFGISIIPEWEDQAEQIRAELTASYEALFRLYNDIIVAMPDASQINRSTEEALRRQLLAGQLGQYPNYPSEQLKAQLLDATAKLVETQPGTKLRVSYLTVDGVDYYTLISDEEILGSRQ
ncbi:MAG TPA: hypothetical protein G4N96_02295 [Chloroflexi bacterium]|nr:MAG: hypothetical protein B6243_12790 [Anaerolineaceae bacterium 4572_5.2]HEY83934.1 hypothetical protein [Chloroflexota bacterium]